MDIGDDRFEVRLAQNAAEVDAALRLRYAVFVEEKQAQAGAADHSHKRESDAFDAFVDHLILVDHARDGTCPADKVIGTYRLLPGSRAATGPGFYSAAEFDLSRLEAADRPLLELGRSCILEHYRGGSALLHLWNGLAAYVLERRIELLFGVASFAGQSPLAHIQALSYLHHHHLAPEDLRVPARASNGFTPLLPAQIDRSRAVRGIPALIKSYLRLGGMIGDGVYVDHDFNTVDICVVMDTARLTARARAQFIARTAGKAA